MARQLGGWLVGVVEWILEVLVFLILWKVVHLLVWNLRKLLGIDSLLLSMVITLLIAIVAVSVFHAISGVWPQVIVAGILLGVVNGEYEYNRSQTKV